MTSAPRIVHLIAAAVTVLTSLSLGAQTRVSVASFESVARYPRLSAPALVVSPQAADLSAQVTAQVAEIHADVGTEVAAGDLLVALDCRDYELSVAMAQARLKSTAARRDLAANQDRRASQLLKQKLTSEDSAETSAANLAAASGDHLSAKAALAQARLDQSRCDIRAPYPGTISARYVAEGQLASAGNALVRIVNHQDLEVAAQVSERDLESFTADTPFRFENLDTYPLALARKVQALDSQSRTQEVRLVFTGLRPLPGSAGKVTWPSAVAHLPKRHLAVRNGVTGYFTVDAGAARFVPVGRFFAERDYPLAIDGATAIITSPPSQLADGTPIAVADDAAEDDAGN